LRREEALIEPQYGQTKRLRSRSAEETPPACDLADAAPRIATVGLAGAVAGGISPADLVRLVRASYDPLDRRFAAAAKPEVHHHRLAAARLISLELIMTEHLNPFGQPIGFPLPDWMPRQTPPRAAMAGRFCQIEPLDPERHVAELFAANREDRDGRNWTYLPFGPFEQFEEYRAHIVKDGLGDDPLFQAILEHQSGRAVGVASFMRIDPAMGIIEFGGIYSPLLQRTPAATEVTYLMMRRVFDELGYRRYEWKCDALNAASRAAAARLGFRFEGIFRQAMVYKGRNRDTAWFSVIDREWPALKRAFEDWLDPKNFDEAGRQRRRLASFRRA